MSAKTEIRPADTPRILDATAGNRTMWRKKDSQNIIYIDLERRLEVKPTIVCSNEKLPFPDHTFHTIFYDPPHSYGSTTSLHAQPNRQTFKQRYPNLRFVTTYYGFDKYKTKHDLIAHIYRAQKELARVLVDTGLLWFKWNEMAIPLNKILTVFTEWDELLRIYVKSPLQTVGSHQTYWICMEKKRGKTRQLRLA